MTREQTAAEVAADAARGRLAVCTRNGCGWTSASATEEGARILADRHAEQTGHAGVITATKGR